MLLQNVARLTAKDTNVLHKLPSAHRKQCSVASMTLLFCSQEILFSELIFLEIIDEDEDSSVKSCKIKLVLFNK